MEQLASVGDFCPNPACEVYGDTEANAIIKNGKTRQSRQRFQSASPHLNPQEHVWSQARAAVSHNHTFPTFQQLTQAFLDFLSSNLFPFNWLTKYAPAILFEV